MTQSDAIDEASRSANDVLRPDCPSRVVMQRIGERWSMFVILALADGPLRFTALKARVGVVTSKVLTETLRALETDGLIARQAYAESPPRVEYELTGARRLIARAARRHARVGRDARARGARLPGAPPRAS